MGTHIKQIDPENGTYTLEEMQRLVGGYVEAHPLGDGEHVLLVNEDAALQGLPVNSLVSALLGLEIRGDAAIVKREQIE